MRKLLSTLPLAKPRYNAGEIKKERLVYLWRKTIPY
jgi:hypothetical protein